MGKGKRLTLSRAVALVLLAYPVLAALFYLAAAPQLRWADAGDGLEPVPRTAVLGELTDGRTVSQRFTVRARAVDGLSLVAATYGRPVTGVLEVAVTRLSDGALLYQKGFDAGALRDNAAFEIPIRDPLTGLRGEELLLTVTSRGSAPGAAPTLWYGPARPETALFLDGRPVDGTLCLAVSEKEPFPFALWYGVSAGGAGLLLLGCGAWLVRCQRAGKPCALLDAARACRRYRFLLSQLVGRDFKTKYRRSYLGVCWSILNPLLMMAVVSSVFSYVFRFNIEHFPVYLILGQTFFNFLSESTTVAMGSVIGSGQLIKKVYVPKYIFPLEKVFFSFVNLLISFAAIALVLAVYRIPLHRSIVCLPLILFDLFLFCLGLGLFLSAFAVFFRDTLHLYSVLLTAWNYLTPVFYPVSSLSREMAALMNLNPMHHFIRYFRDIVLYGRMPTLQENWLCFGFAAASLLVGTLVFRHRQDRFILFI